MYILESFNCSTVLRLHFLVARHHTSKTIKGKTQDNVALEYHSQFFGGQVSRVRGNLTGVSFFRYGYLVSRSPVPEQFSSAGTHKFFPAANLACLQQKSDVLQVKGSFVKMR